MKKGCRITLIVFIVLLCISAVATGIVLRKLNRALSSEPKTIASIHRSILSVAVPKEYVAQSGMDLMGYRTVEYRVGPVDQAVTITFIELKGKLARQENARDKLRENAERRLPQDIPMQTMPPEMVTVRGKPIRVTILEPEPDSDTPPFRQWSGVTESDQGLVLFMVNGHPAAWDYDSFKSLIQSIR